MTTPEENGDGQVNKVTQFWASIPEQDGINAALHRVMEKGPAEFLETYFITRETYPDEYAFYAEVKADHGGGKYELRITTPGGQWVAKPVFCIGGKPKREEEEQRAPQQPDAMSLLMQMQERSDARLEKILERMASKPDVDPLAQVERVANILNKNTQPPVTQEKSLIEKAMEKKFLDFLDNGLGGPQVASEFSWVKDLVMEFGPALAAATTGKAGDEVEDPPAKPTPSEEQQREGLTTRLKLLLTGMVQLADYGVPPANTVEKVKAQAGDQWPGLEAIIRRQDAVTMAASLVPAVQKHRPWFEEFRAAVIGGVTTGEAGDGTAKKPHALGKPAGKSAGAGKGVAKPRQRAAVAGS